jgi:NADH-quinone oxidoreductase subunit C
MLKSGELKELLARDLPEALAPPRRPSGQNGHHNGTVQEGAPANAKGVGGEGTRPVLQDNDVVITPESLPRVAAYLRDRHGYQYLSHIVAVDYILEGLIEVLYQFFHLEGGGPQNVRVRVPRKQAVIPTLTGEWPGANLQERHAYDLFGVHFTGHPYLRRIYLWDEFQGHPMLKDFPKTGDKYTHETGAD